MLIALMRPLNRSVRVRWYGGAFVLVPFWQQCCEEYGWVKVVEDGAPGHKGYAVRCLPGCRLLLMLREEQHHIEIFILCVDRK